MSRRRNVRQNVSNVCAASSATASRGVNGNAVLRHILKYEHRRSARARQPFYAVCFALRHAAESVEECRCDESAPPSARRRRCEPTSQCFLFLLLLPGQEAEVCVMEALACSAHGRREGMMPEAQW